VLKFINWEQKGKF